MATQVDLKGKKIQAEYQIAASTSASTAQLLAFPVTNQDVQDGQREAILAASGAAITFLFGNNSSIAASTTASSNLMPAGNFTLLSGAIYSVRLLGTDNYVSVKTATGTGTAIIQLTTPIV